jgi:anti-sigma28 factor (negative regulator of flagellin synthesis)
MDTNNIISQVAQLIRTRDIGPKDPKEIKVQKQVEPPKDEVELSSAGESFASAALPDYEKEQAMKVERLKSLVQTGNYKMDEEMINNIAERIAKNLLA